MTLGVHVPYLEILKPGITSSPPASSGQGDPAPGHAPGAQQGPEIRIFLDEAFLWYLHKNDTILDETRAYIYLSS